MIVFPAIDLKAGQVQFRTEKHGVVAAGIGKVRLF